MLKVSIRQIKAARALLGWSQETLAKRSSVSLPTIKRLEAADTDDSPDIGGRPETSAAIRIALENAGIQFLEVGDASHGPGVALAR